MGPESGAAPVSPPRRVARREVRYPVRISLNVAVESAEILAELERCMGHPRGVLARAALERGLEATLLDVAGGSETSRGRVA